jgi:hypothetical protein
MEFCGLNWSGSGTGQMESFYEHGNEPPGSTKCWGTTEWRPLEFHIAKLLN